MGWRARIFFTRLTRLDETDQWYLHRQKYLTFFLVLYKLLQQSSRDKYNYVSNRDLWINRLYFGISKSTKRQCLAIDTRDVNDLGPAKYRTQTDSNQEQICYHNRNKRDTSFNSFLAVRKQTSANGDITFSTAKIIDKRNKNLFWNKRRVKWFQ